jgi:hypothetical protein
VRRITWKRVVDMNDRALRNITIALGGPANGYPRQDGFDIVVASEIMAIFCLAESLADLKARFARIVVGYTRDQKPVHAGDLDAQGAMTVLLRDALQPNLVQTLENNPAFIHGGPFGNIAHGCNSVIATKAAIKLADYVVTEAGFGADLGAEKFIDIKCRKSGLRPDLAVLGGDDPRAQVPRRRRVEAADAGRLARARAGHRQPRAAHDQRPQQLRPALRRGDQSFFVRHGRRNRAAQEKDRTPRSARCRGEALGRTAAPAPRSLREPWSI